MWNIPTSTMKTPIGRNINETNTRKDKQRQGETQDKTGQDQARKEKTRQGEMQDKTR